MKLRVVLFSAVLACTGLQGCALCQRHDKACDAAALGAGVLVMGALVIHDSHQKSGCTCGCPGTRICQ